MKNKIPKIEFKNIDSAIEAMQFVATLILAAIIFKFFSNIELIINNKDTTLKMYIVLYLVIFVFLVYKYLKIKRVI